MTIFKIDVKQEMARLQKLFKNGIPNQVLLKAGNAAVKAGVSRLNTQAAKKLSRTVNLKSGEIKKEFIAVRKPAKGQLSGNIKISGKPLSLQRFATPASKTFTSQKGVKVSRRKRIKVKIFRRKGATTLKRAFHAFGRGNNLQVFRRDNTSESTPSSPTSTALPIIKMAVRGLGGVFKSQGLVPPVLKDAEVRTRLTFLSKAEFFGRKEIQRVFATNLKKL